MTSYRTTFQVPQSGHMNIPSRVAERHLVSDMPDKRAVCQAIGRHLQVTIWSPNDTIQLRFPFQEWYTGKARLRSVTRESINVGRWQDKFDGVLVDGDLNIHTEVTVISDEWQHPAITKTRS